MPFHENGRKAEWQERTAEYKEWRFKAMLAGVSDVDQIEYRFRNNELVPVAVVELGRMDYLPSGRFWDVASKKLDPAKPQGMVLHLLADRLGVPLLQVLYIKEQLAKFGVWVRNEPRQLSASPWIHMTLREYRDFLGGL